MTKKTPPEYGLSPGPIMVACILTSKMNGRAPSQMQVDTTTGQQGPLGVVVWLGLPHLEVQQNLLFEQLLFRHQKALVKHPTVPGSLRRSRTCQ